MTIATEIETFAHRPRAVETIWRLARSLAKPPGRDPRHAIGSPVRIEGLRLEPRAVARYCDLCGFEADVVPVTFPHMLAFPLHVRVMTRTDFPYQIMGAIHLENSIRQHARLARGDTLDIETAPTRLLRHGHGQLVEVETTAHRGGQTVWESRSLYLFPRSNDRLGEPYVPASLPDASSRLDEQGRWALPGSIGRSYAIVSGDWNPIHLSRATARLFGMRKSIAHGMWMKARAVAAVTAPLRASDRVASVTVSFRTPAFLPGAARLFASLGAIDKVFEVRDAITPRKLLRGRIRLCAP